MIIIIKVTILLMIIVMMCCSNNAVTVKNTIRLLRTRRSNKTPSSENAKKHIFLKPIQGTGTGFPSTREKSADPFGVLKACEA